MKSRKLICFFLACLMLASCITANATENDDDPASGNPNRYTGISTIAAAISINALGVATCDGAVSLHNGYTVTATLSIQQRSNGRWNTLHSWSIPQNTGFNASQHCGVVSGYKYRCQLETHVFDSDGHEVESVTATSTSVQY